MTLEIDEAFYDDEEQYCTDCGYSECQCNACERCHGQGRIVAADGYHEYLGYDYITCPECGGNG